MKSNKEIWPRQMKMQHMVEDLRKGKMVHPILLKYIEKQ
jgi:hypothetical protein